MNSASKIAVGIASAAVVAGLVALAMPALAPVIAVAEGAKNTADSFRSTTPTPEASASPTPTVEPLSEETDYSTWAEEELAPLRAEQPSRIINHPSRFAPGCRQNSMMGSSFGLSGAQEMVDMGATEYASGEVTRDPDSGRLETYTIAPGDASSAIGVRFCTDYVTILVANDAFGSNFQPGKVLRLLPLLK